MGVKARRVERYYQELLASEHNCNKVEQHSSQTDSLADGPVKDSLTIPEKWKGQIEKVITCTCLEISA